MTQSLTQLVRAKWPLLRARITVVVLLLVAALALAPSFLTAAPPANQFDPKEAGQPGNAEPPFQGELLRSPVVAAARVVGVSLTTGAPSYQALSALYSGERPELEVWSLEGPLSGRKGRILLGSSSAFLTGFTTGDAPSLTSLLPELAVLKVGDQLDCWTLRDTDQVRPVPDIVLEAIEDRTGVYQGTLEADSYAQIVVLANYTSHQAFLKAAAHDVSYGALYNHPDEYRGRVIYVEGRLKRVERMAPMFEAAVEGVSVLYVGYLFNELSGANPYRVIFTEWPAGLPRDLLRQDKKIDQDIRVSFAGYFYKRYRYKAIDSKANTSRDAPMLVGHSLTFHSSREAESKVVVDSGEGSVWGRSLAYGILALLLATVGTVLGMAWWFRRSDQRVRSRIQAARGDQFVLPPPDAAPVASPAPPVAVPVRGLRRPFPSRNNLPPGFGDRGGEPPGSEAGGGKDAKGSPDPDEGAGA